MRCILAHALAHALISALVLALVAAFVGLLIGTVGVGGVLMVSYLALFAGLTIHQAAATSLITFRFTGILGTWLYQRRRSIDWRISLPVCAAALVCGFLGAAVAAIIDPRPLAIIIALVIVGGGHLHPRSDKNDRTEPRRSRPARTPAAGLGWRRLGLWLRLLRRGRAALLRAADGDPWLRAADGVATSQVLQIVAATSGSIENLRQGFIDFRIASLVTIFELLGLIAGVRLAHIASALVLRRLAGALCVVTGGLLLARSL
jgi:uncharacterized membrane protein YfcA